MLSSSVAHSRQKQSETPGSPAGALETFQSRLGLVIQRLANRSFLAGDRFTAADISVSYALLLGLRTGNYSPGSVERAYLARTTTRPAYARAMETCQATKAWAERSPTL